MRALDKAGKTILSSDSLNGSQNTGDVDGALASATHVVMGEYGWPSNAHTPIGPQCSVADVTPQGARILSGTQGTYTIRDYTAPLLDLPPEKVRVTAVPMGGCFGDGSQYRDVASGAAVMSQIVGAPVRVQLMRWDEIGWDGRPRDPVPDPSRHRRKGQPPRVRHDPVLPRTTSRNRSS